MALESGCSKAETTNVTANLRLEMTHDYAGCQEPACALCGAYGDGYAAGKAGWATDRGGDHIRDCQGAGCEAPCVCPCHLEELRRTDLKTCSCSGFWYKRSCRHIIAYREAVDLVQAQDAVNLAWDKGGGGNVAVRASQKELERGL